MLPVYIKSGGKFIAQKLFLETAISYSVILNRTTFKINNYQLVKNEEAQVLFSGHELSDSTSSAKKYPGRITKNQLSLFFN